LISTAHRAAGTVIILGGVAWVSSRRPVLPDPDRAIRFSAAHAENSSPLRESQFNRLGMAVSSRERNEIALLRSTDSRDGA
jgi:hypothetical protein